MSFTRFKGLHHIILISFRPDTPEEIRDEIHRDYENLGEECGGEKEGILHWSIYKNRDLRKGVHLVELAVFEDDESFERFKRHEKHQKVLSKLKEVADWQVADFLHEEDK